MCLLQPCCWVQLHIRYRHASQTKEGVGCQALRSPGTNAWLSVHAQGQQPGPWLLFSHSTQGYRQESNPTPPHPHHRGQQSIKPLPQGSVCLANQSAGPKQAVPTLAPEVSRLPQPHSHNVKERELPSCAGRLRAAAHPSPSPFRASGLGRNPSCLTKSKWRRKEGGVASKNPTMPRSSTVSS